MEGTAATLILWALTDVSVNGELLRADEERKHSLVEESQFSIDDRLQIEIRPGGGELPRLKEAVADGERAVIRAQTDLGTQTFGEAEAYLQQCEALEQRIERQTERLRECVPKGIEFLEDELCILEEQLDSLDADANIGTAFDLGTAEHIEQEAHHALESVREQRDNTQEELTKIKTELASQVGEASARTQAKQRLAEELEAPTLAELLANRTVRARGVHEVWMVMIPIVRRCYSNGDPRSAKWQRSRRTCCRIGSAARKGRNGHDLDPA